MATSDTTTTPESIETTVSNIQNEIDETELIDAQISDRVKVLLVRTGGQRQDLARDLRISGASLSRSLSDDLPRRREWSAKDVRRLSIHFNVDPNLFFTDEDQFWSLMNEFFHR